MNDFLIFSGYFDSYECKIAYNIRKKEKRNNFKNRV